MGKISQAAIVAGAAYRNQETFKQQTGITNSRLIKDKVHHDTKVIPVWVLHDGYSVLELPQSARSSMAWA